MVGCFEQLRAKVRSKKAPNTPKDCATTSVAQSPDKGTASRQPSTSTPPSNTDAANTTVVEVSSTPHTPATSDRAACPSSLPERLWNKAYDQARIEDPETVDGYEKILSADLPEPLHADPTDGTTPRNEIEQDTEKRKKQMHRLLQIASQKIDKEANMKQRIQRDIQVGMVFKEVVAKAVQASPEAALAWVGVCIGVQILMNPINEAISNRQGLTYVVLRMDWYWELSSLLLAENIQSRQQGLRGELEKKVTQLYAQLLLYQMKSVCSYNRGRVSAFARDLVKLDNWEGKLDGIKAAEAAVLQDSKQYNTLDIRNQLHKIAETAESQNAKLDSISSAIQEQTKQQNEIYETDEDKNCLKALCVTDPRHDKTRIEDVKGGDPLRDCYKWVLENPDFKKWRDDPQSRLLWVKADPGKGKTMLLCGIINELHEPNLAYFFCQATDPRINSAISVLRGLVFFLVQEQPSLISHVRDKYDRAGEKVFTDANAWVAMKEIFANILNDSKLKKTYLIIDALDECTTELNALLDFIAQNSSVSSRVKWIISSRNKPDIKERLDQAGHQVKLSLELNAESVSAAVNTFIKYKVSELANMKRYDRKTQEAVLKHLESNSNNTFLWVALVCQTLEKVALRNVMAKLKALPSGLSSLYKRMIVQISGSDDADVCKRILALVTIACRPLKMRELAILVKQPEDTIEDQRSMQESMEEIIGSCGSFLTVREETIYFVHESAKDFLKKALDEILDEKIDEAPKAVIKKLNSDFKKVFTKFFPPGWEAATHLTIFERSMETMSTTLRRDMYNLKELGYPAEKVNKPDPDPLEASPFFHYAASHFGTHALKSDPSEDFVQKLKSLISLGEHYRRALDQLKAGGPHPGSQYRSDLSHALPHKRFWREWKMTNVMMHEAASVFFRLDQESNVDEKDELGEITLYYASPRGYFEVVQMLPGKRTNVNAQYGLYGNAPQAVPSRRHEEVAQILYLSWPTETASQRPIQLPPFPSKDDPDATWNYIQAGLDRIMTHPWEGIVMKTYMGLYTAIHNFCTAHKPVGSGGFGANNGGINNRGGDCPGGEHIYKHLVEYLKKHLHDVEKRSTEHAGEAFLTFYYKEWNRYTTAGKDVDSLFRYLNRHWVKPQMDEGKKNIYDIYTLHLVLWKDYMFMKTRERIRKFALDLVKQQNGETIEQTQMKIVDSFVFPEFEDSCKFDLFYGKMGAADRDLLKSSEKLTADVYKKLFESFLEATDRYCRKESSHPFPDNSASEYTGFLTVCHTPFGLVWLWHMVSRHAATGTDSTREVVSKGMA